MSILIGNGRMSFIKEKPASRLSRLSDAQENEFGFFLIKIK